MLFVCNYAHSKECSYFNCVIMVDNELVNPSSLTGEYIILKNSLNKTSDTIKFDYNYGTVLFSESDFNKLNHTSENDSLELVFDYLMLRPVQKKCYYKIRLDSSWLDQSFLIVKIYNYDNVINKKIFPQKLGYGVEISNAVYKTSLPRR